MSEVQLGTPGPESAGFIEKRCDGAEALRMARRKDEDKLRIGGEQAGPCIDERGLLAFKRAAGDDESQAGGHRLQPAGGFRFLRDTHIEFEIAGDGYVIGQQPSARSRSASVWL